jgi:hypothetical protein
MIKPVFPDVITAPWPFGDTFASAFPAIRGPHGGARPCAQVRCPRESPDAPKDLPREASRQGAFGQLDDEVPRMPAEPTAGLKEPLLEDRQRPTLDGERQQDKPAQEIAEIVGATAQEQPHLIGPEAVTGEARPATQRAEQ